MSGVLVALGAAVAKTAFMTRTGDNVLADNVSGELTALIAGRVSDARDRQKVAGLTDIRTANRAVFRAGRARSAVAGRR